MPVLGNSSRRISSERSERSGAPLNRPMKEKSRTGSSASNDSGSWASPELVCLTSGRSSCCATARSARTWSGSSWSTIRCRSTCSGVIVISPGYRRPGRHCQHAQRAAVPPYAGAIEPSMVFVSLILAITERGGGFATAGAVIAALTSAHVLRAVLRALREFFPVLLACLSGHRSMIKGRAHRRRLAFRP